MQNFEMELVNSFNKFFEEKKIKAIAYRRKQAKFADQFCDVLVDSGHSEFYLAIENKSVNLNSTKKLYFSQHFHCNERDQLERITDFLEKSGRKGFLALEIREGRGKLKRAFLIDWEVIWEKYQNGEKGLDLTQIKKLKGIKELKRQSKYYLMG